MIEAALRAKIPYLDVAAEIEANRDTFAHFVGRARDAGAVMAGNCARNVLTSYVKGTPSLWAPGAG
ncbi:hypothetical protein SMICM304S_01099 [Streptomyces microflavus]